MLYTKGDKIAFDAQRTIHLCGAVFNDGDQIEVTLCCEWNDQDGTGEGGPWGWGGYTTKKILEIASEIHDLGTGNIVYRAPERGIPMTKIMFAAINDEQGEDYGYGLYYVPRDSRWIITDNAGVACTSENILEEQAELAEQAEALIQEGAGQEANLGGGAYGEAADLMAEWGWLRQDALLSTAQAAQLLGISEVRARQLCEDGRMGRKVGRDWVISQEDIEANKVRSKPGRPKKGEPNDPQH